MDSTVRVALPPLESNSCYYGCLKMRCKFLQLSFLLKNQPLNSNWNAVEEKSPLFGTTVYSHFFISHLFYTYNAYHVDVDMIFLQPDAKLAAVDCTKNRKVAGQVKISGYPTGKYYILVIHNH